jgi:DNA modification methylase
MKLPIHEVRILERQRRDFGDIDDMSNSLARFGLIEPIVVDQNNVLVAGHRRLLAAMQLGWPDIDVVRREDLDDLSRAELELEENIRRKGLAWPEEVRAIRKLYRMRQERYGDRGGFGGLAEEVAGKASSYSVEDLADEIDKGRSMTHFNIRLADALDELPAIEREPTKKAAWSRYESWRENKIREELAKRTVMPSTLSERESRGGPEDEDPAPSDTARPIEAVRQPIKKIGWKGRGLLYHGDARDVLKYLPSDSVDAIVTDPPFALGMFRKDATIGGKRLAEAAGGMYEDTPQETMDMIDDVMGHAQRVLKPDGHVYCFFHMTRYEPVYLMLRQHFGDCEPTPIIWIKNTPGIGDPGRGWVYAYEPCFFVNRGRKLCRAQAFNYLKYDTIPPSKKTHPTAKPPALLRHLIRASCVKGEVVLDPFAGSGSTLVAAYQTGCRFIGVEREEQYHRIATENLAEALAEPPPKDNDGENAYEAGANLTSGGLDAN